MFTVKEIKDIAKKTSLYRFTELWVNIPVSEWTDEECELIFYYDDDGYKKITTLYPDLKITVCGMQDVGGVICVKK